MDRNVQNALAKRLISHANGATTDSADTQMRMPIKEYLDGLVWNDEIETLFKRKPLAVGLSCELPEVVGGAEVAP